MLWRRNQPFGDGGGAHCVATDVPQYQPLEHVASLPRNHGDAVAGLLRRFLTTPRAPGCEVRIGEGEERAQLLVPLASVRLRVDVQVVLDVVKCSIGNDGEEVATLRVPQAEAALAVPNPHSFRGVAAVGDDGARCAVQNDCLGN